MGRTESPVSLRGCSEKCTKRLKRVEERAQHGLEIHQDGTLNSVLTNAVRSMDDSSFLLRAWTVHFSKEHQTTNNQVIAMAAKFFHILSRYIKTAERALASRLLYQRVWAFSLIERKR